ncbi:helix-turn-helix domain-containing protein [Nesterenkonia natronophila]|uniref:helix-turn-helix domain-containing protein n=1 Tax=Nesterenkonia natronophila TaxID=2174932 RepID=UPI001CEF99FF|nr:helix-turn-helix domain-containing protein [Nesterenkonia natronophila]
MTDTNKNRTIVLAVTDGGLTPSEAARRFRVSVRWVYTLLARSRHGGLEAVDPRSRAPHTNPRATDPVIVAAVLALRQSLISEGFDAGPQSIWDRLPPAGRPSATTIWRILTRA